MNLEEEERGFEGCSDLGSVGERRDHLKERLVANVEWRCCAVDEIEVVGDIGEEDDGFDGGIGLERGQDQLHAVAAVEDCLGHRHARERFGP